MNARSQVLEFTCETCLVSDIVACVFDTVLFHRTLGKFRYHAPNVYSVGAVGFEDVDTTALNMTHVRCSSPHMQRHLYGQLAQFIRIFDADSGGVDSDVARGYSADDQEVVTQSPPRHHSKQDNPHSQQQGRQRRISATAAQSSPSRAQISLEFFQRRPARCWPLTADAVPWEVWTLRLHTQHPCQDWRQRREQRQRLTSVLSERLSGVARALCRPQYVPRTPARAELDRVFDTSLPDVQPYLYRIVYRAEDVAGNTGGGGGAATAAGSPLSAVKTATGSAGGIAAGFRGVAGAHSMGTAVRKLIKDSITM